MFNHVRVVYQELEDLNKNLHFNKNTFLPQDIKNLYSQKLNFVCKLHGSFQKTFHQYFDLHQDCPKCAKHQFSFETFKEWVEEINPEYTLEELPKSFGKAWFKARNKRTGREQIVNTDILLTERIRENFDLNCFPKKYKYLSFPYQENVPVLCKCKTHGLFQKLPRSLREGFECPKCCSHSWFSPQPLKLDFLKEKKLTREILIKRAEKVHSGFYRYGDWFQATHREDWTYIKCIQHGYFYQKVENHLQGNGCPECKIERIQKKTSMRVEEFIKKVEKSDIYDYSLITEFKGLNSKYKIKCKKCGKTFEQLGINHFNGEGCPFCNFSKGEEAVRNWLEKNKIKFYHQKSFEDLRYIKPLRFDFFLPKEKVVIEFQGSQHLNYQNFKSFLNSKKPRTEDEVLSLWKEHKKRDELKKEYCEKKGLKVVEIWRKEEIEQALKKYKNKI